MKGQVHEKADAKSRVPLVDGAQAGRAVSTGMERLTGASLYIYLSHRKPLGNGNEAE